MLNCPNRNDQDWKNLVNAVGESTAFDIYANLNGNYPKIGLNINGEIDPIYTNLVSDFGDKIASKIWFDQFTIDKNFSVDTTYESSPYYSDKLSLGQQLSIVSNIAYNINSNLVKGEKVKSNDILDKWNKYFSDIKNIEITDPNIKLKRDQTVDNILNSWGVISNLVKIKLASLQGVSIQNIKTKDDSTDNINTQDLDLDDDGLGDTTSNQERTNFSDDWTLFLDGKNTMSGDLKRLLSTVRDLDENGNTKADIFQTIKLIPFDKVYNSIIPLLTDVKPNLIAMTNALQANIVAMPYLKDVIDILNSASTQLKNEFISNASNHYVRMQYLGWTPDSYEFHGSEINTYRMIPTNTNTNDIAYVISNKWNNNLINTDLIYQKSEEDATLNYNTDKVKEIITNIDDLQKLLNRKEQEPKLKELFDSIGIKLSPQTIDQFLAHGYRHTGTRIQYKEQFTSGKGIFKVLKDRLEKIVKESDSNFQDYNLFDDQVFKVLSKLEASKSLSDFSNSHTRGDNKIIFSYARNKYFTDRINELKSSAFLRDNLEKIGFSSTSEWLQFLKEPSSEGYNNFNYFYADTLTKFGQKKISAVTLAESTPTDHEVYRLGMFMNRGTETSKGIRFGNVLFPTMSDGTAMFGVSTILHNTQMIENDLALITVEALYQSLVASELKRIIRYKENGKTLNIENYDKGATKFIMLPTLNKVFGKTIGDRTTRDSDYNEKEIEFKKQAYTEINKYVKSLVNTRLEDWIKLGILKPNTKEDVGLKTIQYKDALYTMHFLDNDYQNKILKNIVKTNKVVFTAHDLEVNYLLAKAEFHQLVIGDPALYYKSGKDDVDSTRLTFDNISKRLAGDRAPGISLADSDNNQFIQIFAKDRDAFSINQALAEVEAYRKFKSTDAQEFTTLKEHLYIMSKIGKIESEDINKLISKAEKGTLSEDELGLIFQPIKPVNVQHIENVEDDISHRYYIKSSSYPLIKQLTQGLEIDKLRQQMEDLENDKVRNPKGLTVRLAFGSAVKIGNVSEPISIYDNKTGNIFDNIDFNNSYAELNRSGFKIQQDIPYDEDHDHINVVSQASVLIFNNILNETFTYQGKELKGSDLQKIYFDKYGSIYKQKLDQLLKDLEWNGKTINIAKLKEILDAEVQGRNFDINAVAGLTINNEEFTHRLTFNPNISKYESVLNSIVDNRVRKLKMPGSSFILSTEEGYKDKAKIKGEEEIVKHPGIIFTKEWNGQLQSNQIIIPNRFKDNNGNLIDFNEKNTKGKYIWLDETKDGLRLNNRVDSELLKMLGFRIPNQGHSSMTAPNIVGFLPKASGDLVIASRDLVVQMGSDFDIDKLYAYLYNNTFEYSRQEDKTKYDPYLTKYTSDKEDEKTFQNDIIDIYHNILRSGNAKVDSLQYKPLDSEHVKNIADEIYNLRQEKLGVDEYFTPMSSTYDRNTFFENRDGKNGVAVFSALSVLNANLQGKVIAYGKNLQTEDGMKFLPTEIVFGNQRSTIFSDEKTTSNYDFTKSDVISWDQSESVDNAKNKRLSKLNLNTDTFNAKLALNLFGFVDEGYWFLNQDIIHDYINEQNKLRGAGSTSFDKDAAYKAVLQKYQDLAITNGDRVFNFEEDSDATDYQKLANENLSLDLMKQLISKEGTKIENYATIQLAILDKFRDLDQIGIGVKQLISAVNTNSKGLGVSIMENINKEEKIAKLADSVVFQNATSLIGEYITPAQYADLGMPEEYHITRNRTDGTAWYVKPTTINGYASIYSINTVNKIYSEYFSDYFNRHLNQFMTKIIEISGKDSEVSAKSVAKIKQDIFNSYKSYVYTNKELGLSENPNEDRKRLLYDLWIKNKHTQKSLATDIQEIQNTKLGILNPFLNKLNVDIKRGEAPSTITYTASSAENLDEIDIHIGILDLIRNDRQIEGTNYTTKQLVNDLVKYAYLTGGKQNFTSFLKFIPDEYLNELGFNQKIKDYRINSGDLNELNYSELHPFVQQYFQHNTNSVKTIKGTDLVSDFAKQVGDNFVIKPESIDKYKVVRNVPIGDGAMGMREVAPELLSYYKNKKQYLFKLTQVDEKGDFYKDGNSHYIRIATLGNSGLNEYSENEKDVRSNIPDQNPKYKVNNNPDPIKEEIPKQSGNIITNKTISEQYGFSKDKLVGDDIKNVLTNIINNKESQLNSFVADEFLKTINRNNIKLEFKKDNNIEAAAKFDNDHTLSFRSDSINRNTNSFRYFVLHELTHALTWYAAKNSESPEDNKAVRRLRGIFNEVIKVLGEDKINELKTKLSKQYKDSELMAVSSKEEFLLYGGVNLQEMLTLTMNSPEFQKILNDIPYKGEDKSFWKELFDRIMEVLKTIGIKINKGSALHYAMNDIISLANRETEFGDSENTIESKQREEVYKEFGTYYKFTFDNDNLIKVEYSQSSNDNFKEVSKDKDILKLYDRVTNNSQQNEVAKKEEIFDNRKSDNSITLKGKTKDITIDTGKIKLNEQQTIALNKLAEFVNNDDITFALKGYAGTGKTTIMEFLQDYIKQNNPMKSIYFSSPTHRANTVLSQRLENANVKTLHSLFGLSPEMDLEEFDATKAKFTQKNSEKIGNGAILIIDESSMINKELYKFITNYSIKNKVKVVFLGDPKQLKPVKENELSIALTNAQNSYELTKVERTGDNPLLEQATLLREDKPLTKISKINTKDEGIVFTSKQEDFLNKAVELFKSQAFQENPLLLRVLAATNAKVAELNTILRRGIFEGDANNEYNQGELIMGYDNFDLDPTGTPRIINSGDYIIKEKSEIKTRNISGVEVKGYDIILKDLNTKNRTKEARIFVLSKNNSSETFSKLGETMEQLRLDAIQNAASGMKGAWAQFYNFKKQFATPVNIEYKGQVKIKKTLDYGYAHTIHKSQGGTYSYSFIDDNSIQSGFSGDKETQQQLRYVGVTRAKIKSIVLTNNVSDENAMFSPDFIETEDVPLSTRNKVLINEQYRRIQIIKKELALPNVKSDSKRTDELRQQIINIQSKIEDIKEINSLYQITALAEIDLKEADEDLKNKLTDSDIIRIRSKIELWKHGIRELLSDDEANSEVVRIGNIQDGGDFKGYEYYQNWAIRLEDKLIKIEEEHIQNFIKEQRGEDTTVKKIFDNQKDIIALKEYGLDISHTENAIIQSIDKQTKTFGLEAQDEIAKKIRLIDQTTALARPELEQIRKPNTNLFDSFKQYTKEGLETGRILSPYSHEYYKTISDLYYKASATNSKDDWKEYHKFKQQNEILFDFRKLFQDENLYNEETFNEQDKIDHINELKSHLGERAFNKLYSTLQEKYELFKSAYESAKDRINSYTDLSEADKAREIDIWNKTNSPYWASKMADSFDTIYKTSKTIIHNNASWNYTYSVPRRTDVKGEETNWYDKNFDVINNSEKLYNFYEVLTDTLDELNSYLPSDEQQSMKGNAIPTIKKSVYEIFTESGLKNGSTAFMDSVISQLTDREASDVLYANINPETHEVEKELRANFINNNIDEINAIVNQKTIQFVIDNEGKNPLHEDTRRFRDEAIDEISKKRSFDLPKIIKMYASLVHTYRYKVQVEDIMKIADNIIQCAVETQKNREGVPLTNANTGQLITKPVDKSFKHIKGQWDYYIQNFYGKRYQQESIIEHTKKHYTSEEKQQIENLDQMAIRIEELFEKGAITQSTYSSIKDEIQSQIEKLGGVVVDSKVGREFLKFIQIKGMGWNLFSGIGNVGFGFISNIIEASGGRIFNSFEMRKAYGLTMGSMLKNYTFDKVELPTATKIRSLMDKWDMLGDVANELYKRTETSVMSDRMKWLNAYAIQQRSEYMNQAPLMIATLMHMKYNSPSGEIELWEGFNNDGNWNTEKYGEEPKDLISKARLRMKQTSKRLHGNYYTDSPLKVNDKFITTALRQFRTWMFESFNNRFENEHYDDLLGLTVKGRYNTFYQSLFNSNKIGQTSGMSNTIFTIQQLLRKLIGMKTKFDDRFNEVDAANMRMNMTELVMYGTLAMLMLALRASANGDDDKKKRDQLMANYLLNVGIRLQTDITFYTNPMSFSALTQNAIPCATVIQDYYKWMGATAKLMMGEDTIKTGVYAGSSRWLRDSSNLLPFFAQVRKTIATSIQVIKN